MKTKILSGILFLLAITGALAQGNAFTYQGRLNDAGNPAQGTYDLRFKLFEDPLGNTQAGSTIVTNSVQITNGLFMATLDFGSGLFNGSNYWLEVDVRTNGGTYQNLNPLQPVLPTPYAIFANTASNVSGTISSENLSGTYGGPVVFNNSGNNFGGSFSGDGASITNVNAVTLGGFSAASFWKTTGNTGTTAGTNFVGTSDNQPLELRVNGQRALRLTPDGSTNNSPDVIGGSPVNMVGTGIVGATIGGGGAFLYGGVAGTNMALGDFNTIAGGWGNVTGATNFDVSEATVAGGAQNIASGISSFIGGGAFNLAYNNNAVVGGGLRNRAGYHGAVVSGFQNYADGVEAMIGGGRLNSVDTNASDSVIVGGASNTNNGPIATIGGGEANFIGGLADHATIGGGFGNVVQGSQGPVSCTIAGGNGNMTQGDVAYSTIGGGLGNLIQSNSFGSTIAGGENNFILNGSTNSVISGGYLNTNANSYAAVGGGYANVASGIGAFVGGGGYAGNGAIGNIASGPVSVVVGGFGNRASGIGAFVGGGGYDGSGNFANQASGNGSVVSGGLGNIASLPYNFVGGGRQNTASGNTYGGATVAGGVGNMANGDDSTVGGGSGNSAGGGLIGCSTVGGGNINSASGTYSTVGGGRWNTASGNWSTVPGGITNTASGAYSFAAGYFAVAQHSGSFVWADPEGTAYTSDRNNQFKIRATGGVQMDVSGSTGLNPAALYVNSTSASGVGAYINETSSDAVFVVNNAGTGDIMKGFNGGGSPAFEVVHDGTVYSKGFALTSDRNAKENFKRISSQQVLEKVAALAISQWNYKVDAQETQHVGPTAQDFHAAFGLNGADDKHISVVDEGGVALAAIQGLNQKLQQKDAEIQQLQKSVEELKQLVSQLAKQTVHEDEANRN